MSDPNCKPPTGKGRRMAGVAALMAVAVIGAGGLVWGAGMHGLIAPVRVAGGSMADSLIGAHYEIVCADCRFPFRCSGQFPPTDQRALCPNCGYAKNPLPDQLRRGQRVLVDRWAFTLGAPRRWDTVAFRPNGQPPGRLSVKRLAGLPGEQVAIRQGRLYINGRPQRKSLDQLRRMALLVHDNRYQPSRGALPQRWQPEHSGSSWQAEGTGFRFPAANHPTLSHSQAAQASAGQETLDWLTYRHWRCFPHPAPRTEEMPVLDHYGYNQGLSRQLHEVTDLLLDCQLQLSGPGRLALQVTDGRETFQVELLPQQKEAHLVRDGRRLTTARLPVPLQGSTVRIELALCDGQVLFAVDRQVVFEQVYEPSGQPLRPTSRPLGIGAAGLQVQVDELQVFRDIHYLDPGGAGWDWALQRPLGDDEFFLLGDNTPISEDSRQWAQAGLPRQALLGKVRRYPIADGLGDAKPPNAKD